jgi:transposase
MARKRRNFTREFKVEAVKLVTEKGYSVAEAARSLGIGHTLLRSWKLALENGGNEAFPGQGNLPPSEQELQRLRAENKRLQMECDILPLNTSIVFFISRRFFSSPSPDVSVLNKYVEPCGRLSVAVEKCDRSEKSLSRCPRLPPSFWRGSMDLLGKRQGFRFFQDASFAWRPFLGRFGCW